MCIRDRAMGVKPREVYPLVLHKAVIGRESDALGAWIRSEVLRVSKIIEDLKETQIERVSEVEPAKQAQLQNRVGTLRLLCAIWGTGSLLDGRVEQWVVDHGSPDFKNMSPGMALMNLGVQFTAYSLSPCSDALRGLVASHKNSKDVVLNGLPGMYGHLVAGAVSASDLEEIERLSQDPKKANLLTSKLTEVQSRAGQTVQVEGPLYDLLHGLVLDPAAKDMHRWLAMLSICKGARWRDQAATSQFVLNLADDQNLCAQALVCLKDGLEEDASRGPRVLEVLDGANLKGFLAEDAQALAGKAKK